MKHLLRFTPPYLGKINFVGLLCSLFLLAACHSDDNEPIPADDEPQAVTLTINLEDAYTRAISEDEDNTLTRLLIQMADNDVLQTDIKTINLTSGQTTATADYELYASHEYTFLLWADDGSYTYTDLTAITLKDNLSDTQAGLSYAATATWDGSSANIPVTLTHVASKVTLKTTTNVWAGNTLTLTVPQASTVYNVQTGTATDTTEEYEHSIITTDITASEASPVELFSFYVLAADAWQDLTLSCNGGSITVPVNLSGGKHVTLTGDVGGMTEEIPTSSTLDVSFGAWDDFIFELDNLLTDATMASASLAGAGTKDDPYLINNPADLKRYMNDITYRNGKYTRLNTDIQIITDNWTPMDVLFGATFDGGGHTISGEIKYKGGESGTVTAGVFGLVTFESTICNLNVSANISVTPTGTDPSSFSAGGIAGMLRENSTITGCTYSGALTVTGTSQNNIAIGGIAGESNGTISGCTFSGTIDATGASATLIKKVGGIVGDNNGTLDDTNKDEGIVKQ